MRSKFETCNGTERRYNACIGTDLIDVRNKNQDNIDTGPLEWKPKELVDGIEGMGK